jgi:hypothetical protein
MNAESHGTGRRSDSGLFQGAIKAFAWTGYGKRRRSLGQNGRVPARFETEPTEYASKALLLSSTTPIYTKPDEETVYKSTN